jgi:GNAT superfamily N-acetyltransferase
MNTNELDSKILKIFKDNKTYILENNRELRIYQVDGSEYEFYIYLNYKYPVVTICNFSISFFKRGTGTGSKLYKIIEEYLVSNKYNEIQLHLVATSAEKFWRSNGFELIDGMWRKML